MTSQFHIGLIVIGIAGLLVQALVFVLRTVPRNLGSNPGFGAFESAVAPWHLALCLGVGLLTQSAFWGVVPFLLGLPIYGVLAGSLARLSRRISAGPPSTPE